MRLVLWTSGSYSCTVNRIKCIYVQLLKTSGVVLLGSPNRIEKREAKLPSMPLYTQVGIR